MPKSVVTEEEIEVAEKLRGQGEYVTALALTQDMLSRVHDEDIRFRLLYNSVCCSTRLNQDDVTDAAIMELDNMSNPDMSRFFVNLIKAISHIALYRPQEALDLIDLNLKTGFMEKEEYQINKYQLLAYKGSALIFLGRRDEALISLTEAHKMYPGGERETDILFDLANCLNELKRYNEAYVLVEQVLKRENGEMAILAMQYMADCCVGLGRISEALRLFTDILKNLPCSLVQEDYIRDRIRVCMDYQEKCYPQARPI
jgi:tetratricopeptide (TPR) repeat protein